MALRINKKDAYLGSMKSRLNITIEDQLMERAKRYAARHHTSVSQLVEQYFKTLTKLQRKKNILQMVEELPKPDIAVDKDLKEGYFQDQKHKYGF